MEYFYLLGYGLGLRFWYFSNEGNRLILKDYWAKSQKHYIIL